MNERVRQFKFQNKSHYNNITILTIVVDTGCPSIMTRLKMGKKANSPSNQKSKLFFNRRLPIYDNEVLIQFGKPILFKLCLILIHFLNLGIYYKTYRIKSHWIIYWILSKNLFIEIECLDISMFWCERLYHHSPHSCDFEANK